MKKTFALPVFCFICSLAYSQKYTVSGTIRGTDSGENLIGTSILNLPTGEGTVSNNYGFYSLTLSPGPVELRYSYVGHPSELIQFNLRRDTTINVGLRPGTELNEITITAAEEIQETSRMGTIDLPIDQIKKMPAFMGETDVLKVLQLLPGVQSGVEGSSGLYVRGGGPDQNLILLDGVPLYNVSHLFGFFSVFNGDAINRVELVKGGFPARYGGRLSSVIDVSMKEGNTHEIRGEGAIGIVASRLTVDGPIGKKTSFIVSGRRTYIDILAQPIIRKASDGNETAGYYFYDLNAKINHTINDKNRIYLSTYTGDDKAYMRYKDEWQQGDEKWETEERASLQWGNVTTALRWNRVINDKLFSNTTATFSRYRFAIRAENDETHTAQGETTRSNFEAGYFSGIRDFALKLDFDFIPSPEHYVRFGAQGINHLFSPGVFQYNSIEKNDTTFGAQLTRANEFFAYLEDDFLVTRSLKVNAGLHASLFRVDGRYYHSFQPRLAMRYLVNDRLSLKASYSQMAQYIHLLSNVGIGLPTDLWVPSTGMIEPQQSWQISAGSATTLGTAYEFSAEGYYKEMTGLIEYKEGAQFVDLETDWQSKIETGQGDSYGVEFFIHKKTGVLNGWIGYTLSWTNRQFAAINDGKSFPYRYDRRHDIGTALIYKLDEGKEFSLTWVYGTGMAVTLPRSEYASILGNHAAPVKYYGSRNSFRMNSYHRLDVSYTISKKRKWGESSWVFGIYNVYNRRNPFFLDIGYDDDRNRKFIQISLFPFIPSFSYRFKF